MERFSARPLSSIYNLQPRLLATPVLSCISLAASSLLACLLSGRGERSGSRRIIEFRAATSSKSLGFLAYSGKIFDIDFTYRDLMIVAR